MDLSSIFGTQLTQWLVVPVLIFCARLCDVSIGTIRIISISRGKKLLAPLLGFFEILIWLLAIRQIFQNLDNPACFVAYAGGFTAGNFAGIYLEEKLALGSLVVRVITKPEATGLVEALVERGYGVTCLDGRGATGPVNVILTVIQRSDLRDVVALIRSFNPRAFYSVEDLRHVSEGIFPLRTGLGLQHVIGRIRKGK